MTFVSRLDAGEKLGAHLRELAIDADLIAGLPRGGVIVAAAAAHFLSLPLDILVVRKIGHPLQREFAVGALAEGGVVVLDERSIGPAPERHAELEKIIREENLRLGEYDLRFHAVNRTNYRGRSVLLVDDGLATGATTEAAVRSARKQGARWIIVAAPVASTSAVHRLSRVADDVIVLFTDPDFDAVGRYYQEFSQTTDEEVLAALRGSVPIRD